VSKPKKEVEIGPCSYCGDIREMEPEHVVPQSIFVNKNRAKIIIPACHDCNHEKGRGEGDLRDYLIIRVGDDGHPDIRPLMYSMRDSYLRGSSSIGRAAAEERKPVIEQRSSGIYRFGYEVPIPDPLPMDMSLRYLVRGLYFYEVRRAWLKEQPLSLSMIEDEDFDATIEYLEAPSQFGFRKPLGNNVFTWLPFFVGGNPDTSAWLMVFFGKVAVVGWIGVPEDEDERKVSFGQMIRRKGRREKQLRGIVSRGLVQPPPNDLLGYLRWHKEKKRKTPPGNGGAPQI
jgi:hypothetical protein